MKSINLKQLFILAICGVVFGAVEAQVLTYKKFVKDLRITGPEVVTSPDILLSTTALTFSPLSAGLTSGAKSVLITSSGTAPLNITSIASEGAEFSQSNNCPSTLAVGSFCKVDVIFSPAAEGSFAGSLKINSSKGLSTVSLSGQGNVAASGGTSQLSFDVVSVGWVGGYKSFMTLDTSIGNVEAGASANWAAYLYTDQHSQPLLFSVTSSNPEFVLTQASKFKTGYDAGIGLRIDGAACGFQLSGGSLTNCQADNSEYPHGAFALQFSPATNATPGVHTTTLTITHNATLSPTNPYTITVSANVTATPVLAVSTENMALTAAPVGTSSTADFLVLNTGHSSLPITSVEVGGVNQTEFSASTSCGSTLAAGASCVVSVSGTPSSVGTREATVTVATPYGSKIVTVTVVGKQAHATLAAASSSSTDFGSVTVGGFATRTLTLSNTGTHTMTGIATSFVNDSGLLSKDSSSTCGTSLGVGATCDYVVKYTPTGAGSLTAEFSVTSSADNSPTTISLIGSSGLKTVTLQGGGYRTWSDGSLASSCNAYLNPGSSANYSGDTGDGIYRVQPSGQSATNVYCDMTTDGGGWTLVLKGVRKTTTASTWTTASTDLNVSVLSSAAYTGTLSGKYSDAFINALKSASGSVYRVQGSSNYFTVPTRFFSGTCVYNQTTESYTTFGTNRPACATSYSNAALTTGARTYSSASTSGTYGGLADHRSAEPTVTVITSRAGATADYYWIGSGATNYYEGSSGTYKNGGATTQTGGAGSDIRMWVR